jgi:hypothetical protein
MRVQVPSVEYVNPIEWPLAYVEDGEVLLEEGALTDAFVDLGGCELIELGQIDHPDLMAEEKLCEGVS